MEYTWASALGVPCDEFMTTDARLSGTGKFAIAAHDFSALGIRVIRPSQTTLLPNEYRIEDMFAAKPTGA